VKIGDLADRTGVSPRSLRYYETRHLISSVRTSGGQRMYDEEAVDRVLLVQQFFRAGLSSADVVQLLPCVYSGTTTPAMIAMLETERSRIDAQIAELTTTRDRLTDVLAEAGRRLAGAENDPQRRSAVAS
jgi:DNA-binding transcriptional MerR regulator